MSTSGFLKKGKLHFIGHRELGVLLVYQFWNSTERKTKLKIANISREEIIKEAESRGMTSGELFAKLGEYLANVAMSLDYKNGITDKDTDPEKLALIAEEAETVLAAIKAGQTVSDADFNFVVDVDNDSDGGFQMTRMSTDEGPVTQILASFGSMSNPKFLTDLPTTSAPGKKFDVFKRRTTSKRKRKQ
jgi:hypothetical protein